MQFRKLIPTVTETRQIKQIIKQVQKTTTYILGGRNEYERIRQTFSREKKNHIPPECKEWQAEDQPDIQQWQNKTTYILRGKNDKQRISQSSSSDKTQPHTCWEHGMTSRGSASHQALTKHNHIQAESKEWQAEDQPDTQQWQNTTTHWLRARNDKQRINQTSSSDKTQPHTCWEQDMRSRGSARHPSVTKHNHILAKCKEWQAVDQPIMQQWQNTTTYKLRARNDKQRIRQSSISDKTQQHTNSEQGMTSRISASHLAVTKHSHIHPDTKEWQAEDQPVIQQWQNTTTYILRARNDKQRISQT